WPKNEILRYTQNDKKREKCFFTQSAVPNLSLIFFCLPNIHMINVTNWVRPLLSPKPGQPFPDQPTN
ncbi:MAG: hypothetical protein ACOCG5_00140, partial [Candidatus Alkaliphilus sp. MAG34]